jgi:hypothetical protein
VWNATHGWVTFLFGLVYRHEETHAFSVTARRAVARAQAAAYSPGIFIAVLLLAIRRATRFSRGRRYRNSSS